MDNLEVWINIVGLVIATVGSILALIQWRKSNDYKRAEFVRGLIEALREDDDIALVMEMIDWDDGLRYDGKFHITEACKEDRFRKMKEHELSSKIDKTLSHYSYICYLAQSKCLSLQEMNGFEYEIRSLTCNPQIMNYLYTIFHFSNTRKVNTTFIYLVDYCITRKWIEYKDFLCYPYNGAYKYCLKTPEDYSSDINRSVIL